MHHMDSFSWVTPTKILMIDLKKINELMITFQRLFETLSSYLCTQKIKNKGFFFTFSSCLGHTLCPLQSRYLLVAKDLLLLSTSWLPQIRNPKLSPLPCGQCKFYWWKSAIERRGKNLWIGSNLKREFEIFILNIMRLYNIIFSPRERKFKVASGQTTFQKELRYFKWSDNWTYFLPRNKVKNKDSLFLLDTCHKWTLGEYQVMD